MNIALQLDDALQRRTRSPRELATWAYDLLRQILDTPISKRTKFLAAFTAAIDSHPQRDEIRQTLSEFWSHHSYVRVISEAGLPDEVFLLRELMSRALKRLMPVDEVQGDLYVLIDSLSLREADAQWLASLPQSLVDWWGDIFRPSIVSILASCKILALRATTLALSRDLLALASDEDITKSSFFHLPALVEHVVLHPEDYGQWEKTREACEARLREITEILQKSGSSASVVFRLRLLRSLLWRIQQVLNLQRAGTDGRQFAVATVHGFAAQRRIASVVNASTRRLARSMVEKTGRAGKHYIAKNAAEWRGMGVGAILAGVITCFTAFFKYAISSLVHPPLLLALGHSINYAVSFLLMQAGGFLLASKMPSATAATLVDAMEDPNKDGMASLQAISQTQFLVTIANLIGAIPASIAVDRVWNAIFHHPFLTQAETEHGIHMLFLHNSATIPYAIITGVFLWLSSLATGWVANYLAVSRMQSAVANSLRVRRSLGEVRTAKLAHWVGHHAAGSAGYVVLGFLLGAVPILVSLFGIPLEVRHVTLAAASLGYALDGARIYGQLQWHEAGVAFGGVIVVGVLNIFTSFVLSFLLAIRARDIHESEAKHFLRDVGHKLLSHPMSFLLPGMGATAPTADAVD
jgi:site-specific recombinase